MAYAVKNYKTKKDLITDFKAGAKIQVYQPGGYFSSEVADGPSVIEGPHFPKPHTFYLSVEVKDGIVVKIHGHR